ncbi:hypothetical protein G6F56_013490 [Rhizopus delemar]|nr:hypothetical protein G6F56_013490 [Rhizopus delemar]
MPHGGIGNCIAKAATMQAVMSMVVHQLCNIRYIASDSHEIHLPTEYALAILFNIKAMFTKIFDFAENWIEERHDIGWLLWSRDDSKSDHIFIFIFKLALGEYKLMNHT